MSNPPVLPLTKDELPWAIAHVPTGYKPFTFAGPPVHCAMRLAARAGQGTFITWEEYHNLHTTALSLAAELREARREVAKERRLVKSIRDKVKDRNWNGNPLQTSIVCLLKESK